MAIRKQRKNLNKHTESGTRLLGESIKRDGYIGAITVAADMETFDGSNRIEVGGKDFDDAIIVHSTGEKPVVVVRDDIPNTDDPKAQRLGFTANQIASADLAFDYKELADFLSHDPIADAIARDDKRIAAELAKVRPAVSETTDAGELIDKAQELQDKWQVQRGDLWQCGKHRILCGDSTNADDVARVNEQKAQLLFTSPPYAAQREYTIGAFDWDALMDGVFILAQSVMNEDGSILVNLGLVHKDGRVNRYYDSWLDRMDKTEWGLFGWYVWDKLNGLMGDWRGRLAPAHEWIFHFAKNPRRANKTEATKYAERGITHYKADKVGLREKDGSLKGFTQAGQEVSQSKIPDSVIRVQPARGGVDGHPAPFSIDFAKSLILAFSNENEFVYEPFLGSGTTLVACEQTGRIGRGIEIEPKYVAVTLERLSNLGLTPTRLTS